MNELLMRLIDDPECLILRHSDEAVSPVHLCFNGDSGTYRLIGSEFDFDLTNAKASFDESKIVTITNALGESVDICIYKPVNPQAF